MSYIKCELCGDYDVFEKHTIRLHGTSHKPDLCGDCVEEVKRRRLEYDASECCFDSVEEYLHGENYNRYYNEKEKLSDTGGSPF